MAGPLPLAVGGMMVMDTFTPVIASGAVIGVLGILFLYMWRQDKRAPWFAWFAMTYVFGAIASTLFAQRGAGTNIVNPALGTAFLLLCFGCLWMGCRMFERRSILWWPLVAVPSFWLASFAVPGFNGMLGMRVAVASALAVTFFLLAARELWRGRAEVLPSRKAMIGFLLSAGVFFAFRIVVVGFMPFPIGGLSNYPLALMVFNILVFVHALFLTVLMIALTKERRESEQRALAESDMLTGLPNRRAFASQAAHLLRKQKHNHAPLALMTLDLDHFKSINDQFGHDAGDRVLVEFGMVLSQNMRASDYRFRMGGEEFCCLLPGLTMREAQAVAERICAVFEATSIDVQGGSVRGTVSIGISSTDLCGYVLEDLLTEADAATYEAKAGGRNRAILAITKPMPQGATASANVIDIGGRLQA